jgi:hypothetical protein
VSTQVTPHSSPENCGVYVWLTYKNAGFETWHQWCPEYGRTIQECQRKG